MIFFLGLTRTREKANSLTLGVFSIVFRSVSFDALPFGVLTSRILQTTVATNGQSTTTLWRAIRPNKEDRVARLEWAANGGLGRIVIGKVSCFLLFLMTSRTLKGYVFQNTLPMSDLVRPDTRAFVRSF